MNFHGAGVFPLSSPVPSTPVQAFSGKDPDAGKDLRQKEKGATED